MASLTSTPADMLFAPTLISPEVAKALPEGYTIRPLQRNDHSAGVLDVLRVLTTVGEVSPEAFVKRFDAMKAAAGCYHTIVIIDAGGKIVGTGALVVEMKL